MNNELYSIKHKFDIAIGELDIFFPLINPMFLKSAENIDFEGFKENVIKFSFNYSLHTWGNVSITSVISDAKLFLNSQELERFYLFAKNEVLIRQDVLKQFLVIQRQLPDSEEIELERIFEENCNSGPFCLPAIGIVPNTNFSKQLIIGIETYFKYFEDKVDELSTFLSQKIKIKTKQEASKKLSDLITHEKSVQIVENIKIQYKNIKGKQLKLLLLAFQELELLPKERIAQKFYDCCSNEFDWKIASYTAMNGYKLNERIDANDYNSMIRHLKTIIKTN